MPFDSLPDLPSDLSAEDEVCRVLRRAAQVIRERGWTQYRNCDGRGRVCLSGAIFVAFTDDPYGPIPEDKRPLAAEVGAHLNAAIGCEDATDARAHIDWNNAPSRTASEVITALEQAADARAEKMKGGK
jgi:hypothetical protein